MPSRPVGLFVEPAARIEAGIVDCLGDRLPAARPSPDLLCASGRSIILGREPGCLEYAVKIARAAADRISELLKRRFFFALSMMRHALATRAAFSSSVDNPSGLQRLQGRKPVALALSRVSCSCTFFGLAVRDGHDGRQ